MAKQKVINSTRTKVKRKGIHAKTKQSKVKSSKHYTKTYRGQGK